jgi:SulP family sulfate permease
MFFQPKILNSFSGYSKTLFTKDVLAGLAVGIVALPLAMAFAIASGLHNQFSQSQKVVSLNSFDLEKIVR